MSPTPLKFGEMVTKIPKFSIKKTLRSLLTIIRFNSINPENLTSKFYNK